MSDYLVLTSTKNLVKRAFQSNVEYPHQEVWSWPWLILVTLQLHVLTFSGQNPNKVPITGLLVRKYHQSINYKTMDEIRDEIYFFSNHP